MNKYVVLSSTPDETYAPFLPVTCSAWRTAGYTPLCLLVGEETEWSSPRMRVVLDHARAERVVHLDPKHVPNVQRATIAQCARLVAYTTTANDDYLLTSDVDIFPLDKKWFNQQDPKKPFHVLGIESNGTPNHFGICYLGGKSSAWREVIGIRGESPEAAVADLLKDRRVHWGTDEDVFAQKLLAWPRFPEVELIRRTNSERIDRSSWPLLPKDPPVDCHCPRPMLPSWDSIEAILRKILGDAEVARLRTYAETIRKTP